MDPWQGKKEGRKLSQWSQEGQPLKRLKIDFLSSDSLKVGHDILWQNRNSENMELEWASLWMMQRFTLWDHYILQCVGTIIDLLSLNITVIQMLYFLNMGVYNWVGNLLDVRTPCTSCSTLVFSRIRQNFSITTCWYECFFESLSS